MKRKFVWLACIAVFVLVAAEGIIQPELVASEHELPVWQAVAPLPALSARAYGVFDPHTGEVIAAENAQQVLPIASVVKLLTASAVVSEYDLSEMVTVSEQDVATYGSAGRLAAGATYDRHTLLMPLLLVSSNDAAATLERTADHVLITHMQDVARLAGAYSTVVADPAGLSDQTVSTLADVARMYAFIHTYTPHVITISQLTDFLGDEQGWANNSPFISDVAYLGGKHGYTEAANRTVVASFQESVSTGERPLGYVLLGSDDLVRDMEVLRQYARESIQFK